MPRVTYDYIRNIDPASLGRMNKSQVIELLKKVRQKYQTRAKSLDRVSDKVYSPAKEKMDDFYESSGKKSPSRITRNQAINEILHIQDFFNAKTSDIKGAQEVMREQDIRIFGQSRSGRPKHRMTVEQRAQFWAKYNEFLNTYKSAEYIYGSGKIQQYLGDMFIKASKAGKDMEGFNPDEFKMLLENLDDEDEEYYDDGEPNVYSGKWDSDY